MRILLDKSSTDFLKLSKHSFNYFWGQLLTKSLGFLLIPLYTRFLTPEDYGILAIITSLVGIMTIIYTLGLQASFSRLYWDYKDNHKELGELLTTILLFITIIATTITVWLWLFGKKLFVILIKDVAFSPYIQLGLLIALSGIYFPFLTTLYRLREKSFTYSAFVTGKFLAVTGISIYFVILLKEGALGQLKGQLLGQIFFLFLALYLLSREMVLSISWSKLQQALRYGLPLVPHSLNAWIMNLFDRFVLEGYYGLSTVGIYNVGYALGGILGMVTTAFNLAYSPYFMKTLTEKGEEAKTTLSNVATLWVIGIVFIAMSLAIFSREIIFLMTPEVYHSAWQIVPILSLAFVFQGMYFMSVAPLFYNKRTTYYIPLASFVGGSVNIIGNFLFIPQFGMLGAAWATVASYFSLWLISLFFARRTFQIPYEYIKILKILLISFIIFGVSIKTTQHLSWEKTFVVKSLLVISYFPLLSIFKILNRQKIQSLFIAFFHKTNFYKSE